MNVGELLHELRWNILHDRSDLVDGNADDTLWSDATLVRYIDEAQRRMARKALCLRDATTVPVVEVTLLTGVADYELHASVLAVISARYDTDQHDLTRAGHALVTSYQPTGSFLDPAAYSAFTPGRPLAYSTDETFVLDSTEDENVIRLRVYPTPTANENLKKIRLRVCRMPLQRLSATALTMRPEVSAEFHLPMLDWAAYLALRIVDLDAGASSRANEFRQSFEAHVKECKDMAQRKAFSPLKWGFGRNGWSGWSK